MDKGLVFHRSVGAPDECTVGCHRRSCHSDVGLHQDTTTRSVCRFCDLQSDFHLVVVGMVNHAATDHCLTDRHVSEVSHSLKALAGESSAAPDCHSQAVSKLEVHWRHWNCRQLTDSCCGRT